MVGQQSCSITLYFTAVTLNVPDHVMTKFLKSTQDLEDAPAKVKRYIILLVEETLALPLITN